MSRGFLEMKEDSDASSVYVRRGPTWAGQWGATDVLDGRLEPGKVFDRTVSLDDVPAGYRAMDDRALDSRSW